MRGQQRQEAHDATFVPTDAEISVELISFLAERLTVTMATKFKSKNTKKEERGKTLNYDKETPEVRNGLDKSREVEWQKWTKFLAGRPCKGQKLQQLIDEGHEIVPTRWVDVDRNAHKNIKAD